MLSSAAPMPSPDRTSLRRRVLIAGGWSLTGYGLSQALRFGSNLLMTRLLVPETFGVMAIAGLVMIGLAMFSDVGLKQSVVQSRRSDPAFLNTAWVIQILRGVLLWFLALCLAFFVLLADRTNLIPKDTVYADPNLPYVIAVLSLTAVISGFQSTKLFEASRNLSLAEVTKIEIAAQIAGLFCMIGWVSIDRSVWALVAGSVCSTLVATLLSHTRLWGVANRWQWDKSAVREIVHFGKWIFLSSILGFLVINGDRLLLGGLVNTTVLGIYVIAFLIFNTVDQVLTKIISEVSFPALSEIARERPLYLRAGLYRFQVFIASFAYFCAGILMTSGQTLIELLYDERYQQAGWMLEVLAVALLTVPFRTVTQCFMALGLPHILSNIIAFRLATLFVATPMGFHFFGLPGALWGIVLSHFSYLPTLILYSAKNSLFDLRKELLLLPTVVMGMAVGMLFVVAIGHWR
jgi:O-antigen/teichoic acid export membrane protein